MSHHFIDILTTVTFMPAIPEQVIDFNACMSIITATPVHFLIFLFHISGSHALLLLPDLMDKHLRSFLPYLDQPINNTVLPKAFMTNLIHPFVFR